MVSIKGDKRRMEDRNDFRVRQQLILDRYEQVGERGKAAGEGVSGIVIKANDTWGRQGHVAIKRPNPMLSLVERRKKSAQIKRESEALKQLVHQVACRYIDDGDWQNSGDHYLIIAWAEGQPIEERLRHLERSGKLLPLGEALEILSQLADLLVHAHSQGVVHNDLDAKHLFWDVEGPRPQLVLIDWANCALSSDTRPIATAADDIRQYGELMHRLLTGSTAAYATRLGGEDNWRVEMVEKKVPESLQYVVARSLGRDPAGPYETMQGLYEDLQAYKQEYDNPIRQKIIKIDHLLEKNTLDSLDQAEALIQEIAVWNPTLVVDQRKQLEQLKQERAEMMARIGGKTSLLAEHWAIARDEIIDIFGDDVQNMPQVEERYIYLLGDLMDKLNPASKQHTLGKQAVDTLFKQSPRDEDMALDKILLLYGADIPDNNPLIEELSKQTGRSYPIRNRIRQLLS